MKKYIALMAISVLLLAGCARNHKKGCNTCPTFEKQNYKPKRK